VAMLAEDLLLGKSFGPQPTTCFAPICAALRAYGKWSTSYSTGGKRTKFGSALLLV
jgi:hypothetical protein